MTSQPSGTDATFSTDAYSAKVELWFIGSLVPPGWTGEEVAAAPDVAADWWEERGDTGRARALRSGNYLDDRSFRKQLAAAESGLGSLAGIRWPAFTS